MQQKQCFSQTQSPSERKYASSWSLTFRDPSSDIAFLEKVCCSNTAYLRVRLTSSQLSVREIVITARLRLFPRTCSLVK